MIFWPSVRKSLSGQLRKSHLLANKIQMTINSCWFLSSGEDPGAKPNLWVWPMSGLAWLSHENLRSSTYSYPVNCPYKKSCIQNTKEFSSDQDFGYFGHPDLHFQKLILDFSWKECLDHIFSRESYWVLGPSPISAITISKSQELGETMAMWKEM